MMRRCRRSGPALGVLGVLLLLLVPSIGRAAPITQVVVFGDSLSDNGTGFYPISAAAAALGIPGFPFPIPPSPYAGGRFSNGQVAVEYLAAALGVPLDDRAQGGATTGAGNVLAGGTQSDVGPLAFLGAAGLSTQFSNYPGPVDPNALYVVWGGPNNLLGLLSGSPTPAQIQAAIVLAVADLVNISGALFSAGAEHVLVPGLPDLGLIPRAIASGPLAQFGATALSDTFNQALFGSLSTFVPGATFYNTAGFLRSVVANPAAFGFTNVTQQCKPGDTGFGVPPGLAVCSNPNEYLFWDDVHPTTRGHALLAREFKRAAVPEPATIILVGAGLWLLGRQRRLRRH
jgi:phospholipase/lecithinase/hemolysin